MQVLEERIKDPKELFSTMLSSTRKTQICDTELVALREVI
jgi:hypothetical protein